MAVKLGISLGLLLAIGLLAQLSSSSLSLYNPETLGQTDNAALLDIKYSIANYGFAPFGKTLIGRLIHSPNFGDECTPEVDPKVDYENSFLLITRGDCEFVTKSLNAQKLGAQMAIISDDKEHKGSIVMADNGYGYKVEIPSIFISYESGELLRRLFEENEGTGDDEEADILMKITFDNSKTEKVDVSFFLQSNNRHSYRFIDKFRKFYPKIQDYIQFKLIYSTKGCTSCQPEDCYYEKNYCALNFKHEQSANGKLILDQQIREQVIFELYPDEWWSYMKHIEQSCSILAEMETCQKKILSQLGIDPSQVQKRFDQSFLGDGDNTYLQKNARSLSRTGIDKYPTVTLNSVRVKGNLHAEFVFDDICNTLEDPPSSCRKYTDTVIHQGYDSIEWPTLVLVVALGILIFSLIFCLYRRFMKKKISSEMQGRVDDMVGKYIEFYSERNK